jgi:alkanesulfonate monooxygenase
MLELGWYCPSEGDGRALGARLPERPPEFSYLLRVVLAAERAGAGEVLVPTGAVNDSFAPQAPFMESWTTAAALAARTSRIRILVALNPSGIAPALAAHQAETLWRIAPGRIAVNLVAGGGPDTPYDDAPLDHEARYARLRRMAEALRARFPGPLYLGGASDAARRLAADVCDTYLMWGEPPEALASRIEAMRAIAGRSLRMGLRIHLVARRSERDAREAARTLVAAAVVRGDRAAEYAAFDSEGQARMNAIPADADGWVAPGLWAGIRAVRGGAGTALVGSYGQVARWLERYHDAGIDLVIGSGYPHLEELRRVARRVWPRLEDKSPSRDGSLVSSSGKGSPRSSALLGGAGSSSGKGPPRSSALLGGAGSSSGKGPPRSSALLGGAGSSSGGER